MLAKKRVAVAQKCSIEAVEKRILLAAVTAVSPVNGGQSVAVGSNITVTFDVAMNASTISSSTLQLRTSTGAIVPAAVTYNSATRTATLDPTSNLASGSNFYYAKVVGGPSGVKDAAGGTLANDFNWAFNTGVPNFTESTVFSGLVQPTAIEFAADGRVFVAEKSGLIKVFNSITATTPTIFADLRTKTHNHWDRGLLGLALDPAFTTGRPYVYALYAYDAPIGGTAPAWGTVNGVTDNGPGTTGNGPAVSGRLSRLTASGNTSTGETVLIEDWAKQYPSHSIGHLQFGPDGYLYASGGDGASFNAVDFGQNNLIGDPPNEGGALRSQDIRSTGDPTSLDGTIIRIDPDTGEGAPGNPFTGGANERRIIAYGLRNPFRFNFRPGTNEIWAADVGWNNWEEINRITNVGDSIAENFGWPAYEGAARQSGYDAANLPLLESLYSAGSSAHNTPYYAWSHSAQVVPGSGEPTGGSSATGVAFYNGGSYPLSYDGAMFFADYSRKRIYVMYAGPNGLPDVNNRQVFKATTNGAVELQIGPNGDLFYADLSGGRIQRFTFAAGSNQAPTASFTASPTAGTVPLTVSFSGAASSDPNPGDALDFAWDLDGDGQFDDSTAIAPTFTYTTGGTRVVKLRVTDRAGLSDIAQQSITVGSSAPTPTIITPLTSLRWNVGDTITFSGSATDPEDGNLAASRLSWELVLMHDSEINPGNPHEHSIQSYTGVASGSFLAPDHESPSWLELRLTATDSSGLSTTVSKRVDPRMVNLTFNSSPSGLSVNVGGSTFVTPFTRSVIAGSANTVTAPAQGNSNGYYTFASWSDGGAATHNITAPTSNASYTATFANAATGTGLNGAYFDNIDFTGTTFSRTDSNINFNWGTGSPDARIAADTFSTRWTGQVLAPVTGLYQFLTTTDDGVRLWVNDDLLVDKFVNQSSTQWSGNIALVAGQRYDLRMDYFENTGDARAELRWAIPGTAATIVPQQFLFPAAVVVTAPVAPSGFGATVVSGTRVDLQWVDNSDNEANFAIERRYAGWIWETLASAPAKTPSYVDTPTIPGVLYEYRIRSTNSAGNSAWVDGLVVNTGNVSSGGVPAAASGLAAVALSSSRVRLTWADNANNETGFKVQRRVTGATAWTTIATANANAVTFDDTTVAANTSYDYRILATNSTGDAPASNIATAATTSSGIPSAPTNFTATVQSGDGSVQTGWTDTSTNETGFQVERRYAGWIWEIIATVGPNVTSYRDNTTIRNVSYEYRVAATSVSGLSGYSNGVIVNIPAAPTNISIQTVREDRVQINWVDEAVNEISYAVQARKGAKGKWSTVAVLPADSTSYREKWRAGKHQYRVFAMGTLRDSDSIMTTIRGRPLPPAPEITKNTYTAPVAPTVIGPLVFGPQSPWSDLLV